MSDSKLEPGSFPDFDAKEMQIGPGLAETVIRTGKRQLVIPRNPQFLYHRIYTYMEVRLNSTASNYIALGTVRFSLKGKVINELPVADGKDLVATWLKKSALSRFANSTLGGRNSAKLVLSNPVDLGSGTATWSVILTPTEISGSCDEISFGLDQIAEGLTSFAPQGLRVYLGVESSPNPF